MKSSDCFPKRKIKLHFTALGLAYSLTAKKGWSLGDQEKCHLFMFFYNLGEIPSWNKKLVLLASSLKYFILNKKIINSEFQKIGTESALGLSFNIALS